MKIYLAPLQGLTDWIFRESFAEHIGQLDKTFSPFIRIQNGEFYRPAQCNDILPVHNRFQTPVPQFLGNDIISFRKFEELCLKHQYNEVNINMGCPFPMVTDKRFGAGLLTSPDELRRLLDGAFASNELKISVKCRLGQESPEEFESLVTVFNDFPLEEIIIHPRVGKQQYKGDVDLNAFAHFAPQLKHAVIYNGDITQVSDIQRIKSLFPHLSGVMIGRGIVQHPFLLSEIRQQPLRTDEIHSRLTGFYQSMTERCKEKYSGDGQIIKRFEEFWSYHQLSFDNGHKIYKQVKKSKSLAQYEMIIRQMLS